MKKLVLASAVAVSLHASSCAVSNEATSNANQLQTQVVLNQKNYKVVKSVNGESKQCYVFGIGGLGVKSMKESAMSEMLKKADLKGSQAIINANVQFKTTNYVFWAKKKAIANGTVIEFTE